MRYSTAARHLPIGIFDSGMGGLTVLKSLKSVLPQESFLYLGDTARLPYGTKSKDTIIRYATQMANLLVEQNIKLMVIACNTASMAALEHLQQQLPAIPIIGVIEPGAKALVSVSKNHQIAVLATEATINSGIYQRTLTQLNPHLQISPIACSLFVALAEEGCVEDAIAKAAIEKYLYPLLNKKPLCDALLLGCTHFPVLQNSMQQFLGDAITIVDSAHTTALTVQHILQEKDLLANHSLPTTHFFVTDSPARFCRVGKLFYGETINPAHVCLVDGKGN